MKKLNKKGFTLVEMLVVIAIIAVLVAIIIPTTSSATTKAKAATDAANLRSITAEATIKLLEGNGTVADLDGLYKMDSKLTGTDACDVDFIEKDNTLVAYFAASSKYYTVDSLSAAAESGKADDAELSSAPTA